MSAKALKQRPIREPHLETTRVQFNTIVLGTDFSPNATAALEIATQLAKRYGSKLVLVNAVAPIVPASDVPLDLEFYAAELDAAKKQMKEATKLPAAAKVRYEAVVLRELAGSFAQTVAAKHRADLIVVGSHGASGLEKILLGSVAESLLRHSNVPVLVVGPNCKMKTNEAGYKSILFATDLGVGSLRAAQYAASLAEDSDAKLTLVHVGSEKWDVSEASRKDVQARLRHLLPAEADLWSHPNIRAEVGDPSAQILNTAFNEEAELIVVGTRDAGPLSDHATWSTVSKIIRGAPCPVLAVPAHAD